MSTLFKNPILVGLMLVLLAACAPAKTRTPIPPVRQIENPYTPKPGDSKLLRSAVYLDETSILLMESYPVQVALTMKGNLPTPCHSLRISIADSDVENRIAIEVYSVADPNGVCIQILEPFDVSIPLGSFPTGHYTVWLNGEQVGEFDA
jgi:hypothetical protein